MAAFAKLLNRSRVRLVKLCREHGVVLRQSYACKEPQALFRANRYAHARQIRRMRSRVKMLRTYLGRVVRDIDRKIVNQADKPGYFYHRVRPATGYQLQVVHMHNDYRK